MNTNSISSNKVTLNISTPQGQEMTLNKGEVLQAQVQDVGEDGLVTILVKGKPVEAYTEVAVKPGQKLLLIVDEIKNGKTYLKVVTPELMGKIEKANITANLLDMGIAAREDNIVLSRKLLQYNLPVNQSNLNELNKNVSSLGGMNARNLEIAAFALARGINGKNALESLAQFLSSPGDTAKLIPVLSRLLNTLAANSRLDNNTQLNQVLTTLLNETGKQMTGSKNNIAAPVATAIDENQAPVSKLTDPAGNRLISSKNISSSPTTGGSGPNPSSTNQAPGSTSNTNSAAASSADKLVQSGPNLLEGEEASSGPKLNPSLIKAANPEAAIRNQATVISGDKQDNAPVKGEIVIGQSNNGSEKVVVEKPAGAGTNSSSLNARVSYPANSMANTDLPTTETESSQIKAQVVLRDPANTAAVKVEEQLAGTRTATTASTSADEPLAGQTVMASEDEIIKSMMGRADSSANKGAGFEPLLAQDSLKMEVLKLLDTIRTLIEIDLEAAPEKIAGKLQGASSSEKDIIKALGLLVDMAKSKDMAERIPELKNFSLSLDRLEKEISGQQLFNVSSRNALDNMSSFYYLTFPVKIDHEYSLCQLKINKDGRKSLKDVDKISFVVSLNTSKLGVVLFHINWQKIGNLQLQGVVENQASCNYLNQSIGVLVSKLEALGYQVKNLGIRVTSSAEEIRIRPVLQEVSERLRPLGIDVTV